MPVTWRFNGSSLSLSLSHDTHVPTQSRLTTRLLRFIAYNTERYIDHRDHGEYDLAVARLRRLRGLIAMTYRAGPMIPIESDKIKLLERHIEAMLDGKMEVI